MKKTIKIHHQKFQLLIPHSEIVEAIEKIAQKINQDFETEKPLFLVVLKGAFIFAGELIQRVDRDCDIEFIRIKSYEGMERSGKMEVQMDESLDVKNRSVIIVEDIVDTGNTIEFLVERLEEMRVKKTSIATLFFKKEVYQKERQLDYIGLEIPNQFVVGFGLDHDQSGRGFKDLYAKI